MIGVIAGRGGDCQHLHQRQAHFPGDRVAGTMAIAGRSRVAPGAAVQEARIRLVAPALIAPLGDHRDARIAAGQLEQMGVGELPSQHVVFGARTGKGQAAQGRVLRGSERRVEGGVVRHEGRNTVPIAIRAEVGPEYVGVVGLERRSKQYPRALNQPLFGMRKSQVVGPVPPRQITLDAQRGAQRIGGVGVDHIGEAARLLRREDVLQLHVIVNVRIVDHTERIKRVSRLPEPRTRAEAHDFVAVEHVAV